MTRLIVIVTVGIAIVVIATVVLYLNPAITGMLGGQEGEQQGIIIDEEMISGSNGHQQVNVTVNGLVLVTDISVTNEQRTKGLSEKDDLAENEAMLFVFGNEAKHTFWMKDMKFPIDIIWLDSNGKIVHMEENLMPCPLVLICPSYTPNADSQYVLETMAGFAQRHDISLGTNVKFEIMS